MYERDSMENACGINSIMKRGMLHAPKERKRISKVQDSLVFQKRLQLRDYRQQVCPIWGHKLRNIVVNEIGGRVI
jgi:hypothetical protein